MYVNVIFHKLWLYLHYALPVIELQIQMSKYTQLLYTAKRTGGDGSTEGGDISEAEESCCREKEECLP